MYACLNLIRMRLKSEWKDGYVHVLLMQIAKTRKCVIDSVFIATLVVVVILIQCVKVSARSIDFL